MDNYYLLLQSWLESMSGLSQLWRGGFGMLLVSDLDVPRLSPRHTCDPQEEVTRKDHIKVIEGEVMG